MGISKRIDHITCTKKVFACSLSNIRVKHMKLCHNREDNQTICYWNYYTHSFLRNIKATTEIQRSVFLPKKYINKDLTTILYTLYKYSYHWQQKILKQMVFYQYFGLCVMSCNHNSYNDDIVMLLLRVFNSLASWVCVCFNWNI